MIVTYQGGADPNKLGCEGGEYAIHVVAGVKVPEGKDAVSDQLLVQK